MLRDGLDKIKQVPDDVGKNFGFEGRSFAVAKC